MAVDVGLRVLFLVRVNVFLSLVAVYLAPMEENPIPFFILGVIAVLSGCVCCSDDWRENVWKMAKIVVIMHVIFLAETSAAINDNINQGKVTYAVRNSLTDMVNNYKTSSPGFKHSVDQLQYKFKCCGVNSSADWTALTPAGNTVPDSCCITVTQGCGRGTMSDASKVYQKGCQEHVEAYVTALLHLLSVILNLECAALMLKVFNSYHHLQAMQAMTST